MGVKATLFQIMLTTVAVVFRFTLWPAAVKEAASNTTLSAALGMMQPLPGPPLVKAHLFASLQLPVPPTQYMVIGCTVRKVQPVTVPEMVASVALKVAPPNTVWFCRVIHSVLMVPDACDILDVVLLLPRIVERFKHELRGMKLVVVCVRLA